MVQANDPFVSFKGVQKSYDGETLVVKNLNLDIASGEIAFSLGFAQRFCQSRLAH